jgi:hypothetical protein
VKTSGFKQALHSTTPAGGITGSDIAEYSSHPVGKLFAESPDKSFQLPIQPEPEFPWETNLTRWICANDHGAKAGDNQDDTAAIQKAVDTAASAGATTVFLRGIGGGDPNSYNLNGTVRIHGSVRHIIGLGFGRVIGGAEGRFVVDDASAPVVKFQHLQAFGGRPPIAENRSGSRTMVIEGCDLRILGTGRGDIFATDCPSRVELRSPGQRLWARQLNPEGDDDTGLVRNHGGRLWALGVKCEGKGVRFSTDNGGQTEIFGMFVYGPGNIAPDDPRPMIHIDNAACAVMGLREITFGSAYAVKLREVRRGDVRQISGGGWTGWSLYSGWTPDQLQGPTAVSWPTLTPRGGAFLDPMPVSAQTTTPSARLHYTTNDSEPTAQSPVWAGPLTVTNTTTLRVKGFLDGLAPSATVTGLFSRLVPRAAERTPIATNGLSYGYYEAVFKKLSDFALLIPVKTGTAAVPDISLRQRDENFALRFAGYLTAPANGLYTFFIESDDGSRLWIGDTLVVDNDGLHGMEEKSGQIALEAGQHPFVLGYFNTTGGRGLAVRYEGPGIRKQAIPAKAFMAPAR